MYKSKEGGSIQMRNIVVQRQIVICKKMLPTNINNKFA